MTDWKNGIARFLDRVDTKLDAQRQRLGATGGDGRPARIEMFRGYGSPERAYLKGRVLRGSAVPAGTAADSVWLNFASMLQRFESDEVAGARVRVVFPGGEQVVKANGEGYFDCWIEPRPPFAANALWHEIVVELVEPVEAEPVRALAPILVPPKQSAFGVISDLDDTVIRSEVTSKLKMLRTVLLGNVHTRVPFPGVSAFYRALQHGKGASPFNPIFYVSSSPWNLHDLLSGFLNLQKIPTGPLLLRDWGLSGEILPTSNLGHKMDAIQRILDLFPALPFILVGDTSQEDPEIYWRVVQAYPDRILAVYIRNVEARPERIAAIRKLSEEAERAGTSLVLADDTLAAARHAAARGWILPAALDEIAADAAHNPQPTASAEAAAVNESLSTGIRD
ncbi:MAG TPA: phosphatase domain-containing protein [Longimicrobium sp.]|nr:phosphatase domain-containing protein [Longimicrobium sp.]